MFEYCISKFIFNYQGCVFLLKELFKHLNGYKRYLILGPLFKLTEAVFELMIPKVTGKIIDNGIATGDTEYVKKMFAVMVILGISGLAFALTCQFFAAKCAYGFGTSLRSALYKHINSLSRTQTDKLGSSTLLTRLVNDTNAVQTGVNMAIRLATRSPFLIIGATVMAISIDFKISCVFLIAAPIIAFIIYKIMSVSIPLIRNNQKRLDNISLLTNENIEGIRVIRAFSRQNEEISEFSDVCDEYCENTSAAGKISALLNPLTFTIMNAAAVVIIALSGNRVNIGDLSQGEVTALVNYLVSVSLALIVFASLVGNLTKAFAGAKRLTEILAIKPSMEDGSEEITENDAPVLEFKNVSFKYSEASENSIEDISFTIGKNEVLGIIGPTGSGKSTIVNLIERDYDCSSGNIMIFGKDIRSLKLSSLHRFVSSVPQKASLISGTVRDNILTGNKNASDEEVISALKIAQAYEFVEKLPDGINAPVLTSGKNFSGGQKQRLTVARAIASKPAVLILDDSTSALDAATDYKLRQAVHDELKNTSVILISQRASSLKNADKILVLDDGKCVGFGTNDYLAENCSVYADIIKMQKAGD